MIFKYHRVINIIFKMATYDVPKVPPEFAFLEKWIASKIYQYENKKTGIDYMYSGRNYTKLWEKIKSALGPLGDQHMPTKFMCVLLTHSARANTTTSIDIVLTQACSEWRGWGDDDTDLNRYDPDRTKFQNLESDYSGSKFQCACSHVIKYLCPIFHDGKDNILMIGNCCVWKYPFPDEVRKACEDYVNKRNKANNLGLTLRQLIENEKKAILEQRRLEQERKDAEDELKRKLEQQTLEREREQKQYEEELAIGREKQNQLLEEVLKLKCEQLIVEFRRDQEARAIADAERSHRIRMSHIKLTEERLRDQLWKLSPEQRDIKLLEYHTTYHTQITDIKDTFIFRINCTKCKAKVMHFDRGNLMCYLCNTRITPNHTPDLDQTPDLDPESNTSI